MKPHKPVDRRARDIAHREAVGIRLRLAREALGKTRRDWTEQFAVSASKLCQWESGANYPELWFLMTVCTEYGLTMDWFFRGVKAGVISSLSPALAPASLEKSAV